MAAKRNRRVAIAPGVGLALDYEVGQSYTLPPTTENWQDLWPGEQPLTQVEANAARRAWCAGWLARQSIG